MILRVVAVAVCVAGVLALAAFLHKLGRFPTASVAARHLREMKDRTLSPDTVRATTYEAMAALPRRLAVGEYSGIEMRAVTLEGYVQNMVRAADGDIHLELQPFRRMPGEPNLPYITAEITSSWRRGSQNWDYARLVGLFRPNSGGTTPWDTGTRRVCLTGWLLYDKEYDESPSPFARPPMTSWEIHPVTRIDAWNDSLLRFVEYPR